LTEAPNDQITIRGETLVVAWVALGIALVALAYCVRHGMLLLYGDAVAHLHIARRVFDSITPGYRQLGSVWLPLPHLLLIPFVWNMAWWQNGLAGACVSIPSYVLGCAGIYRLARMWLDRSAATVVVAFYGLNPGLLYMATTAMTEPLFLAEMIWALLLIVRYESALTAPEDADESTASRFLIGAGLALVCAIFTRYDGWIYAAVAWLFATWPLLTRYRPWKANRWRGPVAGAWVLFTALLVAAPALWLAYNAKQFGDPLDFIRGPYSARAIEARTTPPGSSPRPGLHNMHDSALYFFKAAQLGAAPLSLGKLLCWLSAVGTLAALWAFRRRQIWPVLLLWLPLPFYAYSVAYGSVPIFIPVWRPFSWYNTRYGMELLPAFALFVGCLLAVLLSWLPRFRLYAVLASLLLVVANSVVLLRSQPLVFQEAQVNSRSRIAFETALAKALLGMRAQGRILMNVSSDVGAVQQAGIPLRRIVNEGDYLTWRDALQDPARAASMVVALDGDPVSQAVQRHPEGLQLIKVICATGQPCARIYRGRFAR
jgi:hypothetical protein